MTGPLPGAPGGIPIGQPLPGAPSGTGPSEPLPGGGGGGGGTDVGGVFERFLSKSGGIAEQMFVWGILQQVISNMFSPLANELQFAAYDVLANVPLDAATVASEVARGFRDHHDAEGAAQDTGIDADKFARLVQLAGHGPDMSAAAVGVLRGFIGEGSGDPNGDGFTDALAAAGVYKQWWPIIRKAIINYPSWNDALNAYLEGQLDEGTARDWYLKAGGDPDAFEWLYNTNGTAPTPVEALTLANRGIIPWDGTGPDATSYEQAFLEGPWRNKWEPSFRALGEYLPPPRTVTAMFKEGALTKAEAVDLLQKQGLTPELAAAYVTGASSEKAKGSKDLTESAVISLFEARIIPQADAATLLGVLGYDTENATYLLQLADLRRSIAAVNTAVSRVHALYTGRKIDQSTASSVLMTLGVPADQVGELLHIWQLEQSVTVRQLTPAQIIDAWHDAIIGQDEAQAELVGLGYTPRDAWILMSVKNKGPLPGEPAAGPAPESIQPQGA